MERHGECHEGKVIGEDSWCLGAKERSAAGTEQVPQLKTSQVPLHINGPQGGKEGGQG